MDKAQFDEVFNDYILVIPRLHRRFQSLRLRIAREFDISRNQMDLLSLLFNSGPIPLTRAAKVLSIVKPNITLIVNDLEKRNFVERSFDPSDRRLVLICLSEGGNELRQKLRARYSDQLRPFLAQLPDDELLQLRQGLKSLDLLVNYMGED